MLFLRDLDRKSYWEKLGTGPLPAMPCPNPSCQDCLLRPHGWYRRNRRVSSEEMREARRIAKEEGIVRLDERWRRLVMLRRFEGV